MRGLRAAATQISPGICHISIRETRGRRLANGWRVVLVSIQPDALASPEALAKSRLSASVRTASAPLRPLAPFSTWQIELPMLHHDGSGRAVRVSVLLYYDDAHEQSGHVALLCTREIEPLHVACAASAPAPLSELHIQRDVRAQLVATCHGAPSTCREFKLQLTLPRGANADVFDEIVRVMLGKAEPHSSEHAQPHAQQQSQQRARGAQRVLEVSEVFSDGAAVRLRVASETCDDNGGAAPARAHLLAHCDDPSTLWCLRAAALRNLSAASSPASHHEMLLSGGNEAREYVAAAADGARRALEQITRLQPEVSELQLELLDLYRCRRQYDAGADLSLADLAARVERCCAGTLRAHAACRARAELGMSVRVDGARPDER